MPAICGKNSFRFTKCYNKTTTQLQPGRTTCREIIVGLVVQKNFMKREKEQTKTTEVKQNFGRK